MDDPALRVELGITTTVGMANLRRHLYGRLLDALRRQHRMKDDVLDIREQIDYAHLLYDRGLFPQALRILKTAKARAKKLHLDLHHLLIVEFEKTIESRHITRADAKRMDNLTSEAFLRQTVHGNTVRQSNLQLMLQRYFITNGQAANAAEARRFRELFRHHFTDGLSEGATFRERILSHRCRFWYYYNMLELVPAAGYARLWVAEFDRDPALRFRDADIYIKGIDRCLMVAFYLKQTEEHTALRERLAAFMPLIAGRRRANTRMIAGAAMLRARLNQLLLEEAPVTAEAIDGLAEAIGEARGVDRHKRLVPFYKLGVLCALNDRPERALDFLEPILSERSPLRYDVIVYARLLHLCCHYRMGNPELVRYGVNNLARYLGRVGFGSPYPRACLQLLRTLLKGKDRKAAFRDWRKDVKKLRSGVYHRRNLRYLEPGLIVFLLEE